MPRSRPLPTPALPPATARALGGAPLIPGDDRHGYDALLAGVADTVRPTNLIEQAWVRDVVDLIWEAVRLRRLKAALMTSCAGKGLDLVLTSIGVAGNRTFELVPRWAARRHDAVAAVEAELDAAGLGIDHVMAQTLRLHIDKIERIDRMAASAEARRAATLREIALYRAELAASLRRAATAAIEDAEFEVVEAVATPAAAAAEAAAQPEAEAAE
jgi:hypothetical protein